MYKAVFQNSKTALVFAGMTIFGAVSMVGTSEDAGLVSRAVDTVAAQRDSVASDAEAFAQSQSVGDQPATGSGSGAGVFGAYIPPGGPQQTADPMAATQQAGPRPTGRGPTGPGPSGNTVLAAPRAPGAVVLDNGQVGVAVITDREMTIQPQ
jgi:hypothetical protein